MGAQSGSLDTSGNDFLDEAAQLFQHFLRTLRVGNLHRCSGDNKSVLSVIADKMIIIELHAGDYVDMRQLSENNTLHVKRIDLHKRFKHHALL